MAAIIVTHEHVVGADYSGLSTDQFTAQGSTFEDCSFDRAKIGSAAFGAGTEQSTFVRCSFDRASLTFLMGVCALCQLHVPQHSVHSADC